MDTIIDKNKFDLNEMEVNVEIDRIKILEFASGIDEWENQNLFSQNGFYSLKGKEVLNKTEKILEELSEELEIQLGEIEFDSPKSRQVAEIVKSQKLDTIRDKMLEFEKGQKEKYSFDVIENSLRLIKEKSLKYKFNPEIVNKSYFNALHVIDLLGELKQWNKEEFKLQIKSFNSEFFENLVWGYIEEHSNFAEEFFNKNKHYIVEKHREEIEKALEDLKNKLLASEISKKIFNDNCSEKDALKSISEIKDENVRNLSKIYFDCLNSGRKNLLESDKKELVNKSWENIDIKLKENSDEAFFEVNLHQDKQVIDEQISYITQIIKSGKILTNDNKFFELYQLAFENSEKFYDINLNNYKANLSEEDINYFKFMQENVTKNDFSIFKSDYLLLLKYFVKDNRQNVELIKNFNAQVKEYEKINKKGAFVEQRADIIKYLTDHSQKNRVSNTKNNSNEAPRT